jgi:hypothetical protein
VVQQKGQFYLERNENVSPKDGLIFSVVALQLFEFERFPFDPVIPLRGTRSRSKFGIFGESDE